MKKEDNKMRFVKGILLGSLITAGTMMMYSDSLDENKKKLIRRGKHFVRKVKMAMQIVKQEDVCYTR